MPFCCADGVLCCTEAFYFDIVPLAHFLFCFPRLRRRVQENLLMFILKRFLPTFCCKTFMVSWLTFSSLIHLEFTFVYESDNNPVHSPTCSCPVLPTLFVKGLTFPHCRSTAPWSCINWANVDGFIPGLSILFHWSMGLVFCQYHIVLITVAL